MTQLQETASLHEKSVQAVARNEVRLPTQRTPEVRPRSSRVQERQAHPAYVMAYALGIASERIEVTAEPPLWGCVIHNSGSWRSESER